MSISAQFIDTTVSSQYERDICQDNGKDDIQKSIDYYSTYTKENQEDLQAFYNLAFSYYKLADSLSWEKSIIVWDYIINKESCFNYALHNRGLCKFLLKNAEGACDDFRKALRYEYPNMDETKKTYHQLCE